MNLITIELNGLRFFSRHGVLPQEAAAGNEFIVDLSLDTDATQLENMVDAIPESAVADTTPYESLDTTISYAEIYEVLAEVMACRSQLLETVAIRAAEALQTRFPAIIAGRIRLTKPAPPIPNFTGAASVTYSFG